MIIVGAGGFAKELLDAIDPIENLVFFDDVTPVPREKLFNLFEILHSEAQALAHFEVDNRFCLGTGKPALRKKLAEQFIELGGQLTTVISRHAQIGQYACSIGEGSTILSGAQISSSAIVGKGCLVYYNAVITHDCVVGDFCELSPGATLLGRCTLGAGSHLGANCTVLPGIQIGANCVVGAGAVVTRNVPDNSVVYGVPARLKD